MHYELTFYLHRRANYLTLFRIFLFVSRTKNNLNSLASLSENAKPAPIEIAARNVILMLVCTMW